MSLLDQLSSLCSIPSTYTTSMFSIESMNINMNKQTINGDRQNHHIDLAALTGSISGTIKQPNHNHNQNSTSQQKVIKLFDDDQLLKPNWRCVKKDKKSLSQSKPYNNSINHKKPIQFVPNTHINKQYHNNVSSSYQINTHNITHTNTSQHNQQHNQSLLINLTKISYLVKNKLRKINYDFFVRLQSYSKFIKAEKEQVEKINKQQKIRKVQNFINKLTETIGVIQLKYFHNSVNHNNQTQCYLDEVQIAFRKIKARQQLNKKLNKLTINCTKLIYKQFFNNLQKQNKKAIKIELFQSLLNTVISKNHYENQRCFMKIVKCLCSKHINNSKTDPYYEIKEILQQLKPQNQQKCYQNNVKQLCVQPKQRQQTINMTQKLPLNLYLSSKVIKTPFNLQQGLTFHKDKQQSIPLKLHSLKTHDQQINLNDCVDNGHLLMTQMKANSSFRQQLENLTISHINSKTNNSSLNSSFFTSDNFIMPHFNINNNDATDRTTQERSHTMRKQKNQQQKPKTATLIPSSNPTKQSRKSLVITKRKQSFNSEINSYTNSLYNTERQKTDNINKKPKSTTHSSQKISQKYTAANDKEIIKKMLQQLNEKFQCHDKIINITLSNKKPTSTQKKQPNVNSTGKKVVERKKVNSELVPNNVSLNNARNQKQSSLKHSKVKSSNKNEKKTTEMIQNQSQIKQNDVSICFKALEIPQNQCLNPTKKQALRPSNKPQDHRMKQSRSELTKKNSNLMYQVSEDSEICKILSKYRTKKSLLPESNLKIDLLPDKNKDTPDVKKQNNYYLGLSKPQSRQSENSFLNETKCKNSIFFRNPSMNDSDNNVSLNTSQLSSITPKQSIRDSFFSKKSVNPQLSTDRNSAFAQYISYLPQQRYFLQNEQENNSVHYTSLKPFDKKDTSQTTYYFQTGSKKQLFKPVSSNPSFSTQKKRTSFEKNKDEWDLMFQKQKNKFVKNQQLSKMTKKKSLLNQEVISEIKNKIQQCFILSQKDQNSFKADLTLKKNKNQHFLMDQKSNQTIKSISQQSSKKNSLSKLYTTLNKLKRPEA